MSEVLRGKNLVMMIDGLSLNCQIIDDAPTDEEVKRFPAGLYHMTIIGADQVTQRDAQALNRLVDEAKGMQVKQFARPRPLACPHWHRKTFGRWA